MDTASRRYLSRLDDELRAVLGTKRVGAYLHGSAALGGYDAVRSDLDVLVVVAEPLEEDVRADLAVVLLEDVLPCPARGLELSVVTRAEAGHPSRAPAFELHLATMPEDTKAVDGHDADGDPDLVLHFAVCRVAGQPIGAAAPRDGVFAPVPRRLIVTQLVDELTWAVDQMPNEYAVLNACRAWKYAFDGSLVSKLAGGEWALGHVQRPRYGVLITTALARQRSLGDAGLDASEVAAFVAEVAALIGRSGGSPD